MSNITVLSVLIITIVAFASGELKCGNNEVLDDCPADCGYDYCPKNDLQDLRPCTKPTICPSPRCKCAFNYRRADNNTCIHTTDCPPFDCPNRNEVYDSCPPLCPTQRCSEATPSGLCPFFMLFVVECSPMCRCIPQHWRDNGVCVPYNECPNIKARLDEQH